MRVRWGYHAIHPGYGAMMASEGKTIKRIRDAVRNNKLKEPFSPAKVSEVLGIHWAGVFLPKHRKGNPGGYTELFIRVSSRPAKYRLMNGSDL
jgi:hypothetical protein